VLRAGAVDALRNVPAEWRIEAVIPVRAHLRMVLTMLILLTGLSLAWLLASSELTGTRSGGCLHRTYRDPVTGRFAPRHCWTFGAAGASS